MQRSREVEILLVWSSGKGDPDWRSRDGKAADQAANLAAEDPRVFQYSVPDYQDDVMTKADDGIWMRMRRYTSTFWYEDKERGIGERALCERDLLNIELTDHRGKG